MVWEVAVRAPALPVRPSTGVGRSQYVHPRYQGWATFEAYPRRRQKLPEPDGAWPIIGHILAFGPHDLWYRKLSDMADKVGPVFAIRLGKRFAVVINNWELAKECFTSSNDKTLASRPTSLHSKYMGYNGAMFGFATEGPYLREVRKLITQELFSNKRLQALNHLRVSEIDLMIRRLKELSSINDKSGDHQASYQFPRFIHSIFSVSNPLRHQASSEPHLDARR
ncbi:hypothetical protein Syun_004934 [Stephania yunnanensis]|uniref:Cytochrome P450 n=1 Tax=Stephania yunnanensis TaxID=152371 RepID=A0AAP0Q1A1_9MAGN